MRFFVRHLARLTITRAATASMTTGAQNGAESQIYPRISIRIPHDAGNRRASRGCACLPSLGRWLLDSAPSFCEGQSPQTDSMRCSLFDRQRQRVHGGCVEAAAVIARENVPVVERQPVGWGVRLFEHDQTDWLGREVTWNLEARDTEANPLGEGTALTHASVEAQGNRVPVFGFDARRGQHR